MASPMFWFVLFAVLPLTFELFSWALGKWYQGRLIAALDVREKQDGSVLENESIVSTANPMTRMGAASSTLLHVSICVGPSIGQVFFMWVKSIFGGRQQSYDVVLDYGRREVLYRLQQQAKALDCTSVINVRIETSVVSTSRNNEDKTTSVEFLAFATGLRS